MTPKALKKMAQELGIDTKRLSDMEIICAIQRAEGNFDCYATASVGECDQTACFWRGDCLGLESRPSAAH